MERHLGRKLLLQEHVHHCNGNWQDNRLENLEVLPAKAHLALHRPPNLIPRHLRPERQRYMKAYLRKYRERTS